MVPKHRMRPLGGASAPLWLAPVVRRAHPPSKNPLQFRLAVCRDLRAAVYYLAKDHPPTDTHSPGRFQLSAPSAPVGMLVNKVRLVIPVYNDWTSFRMLLEELDKAAATLPFLLFVSAVDDGSHRRLTPISFEPQADLQPRSINCALSSPAPHHQPEIPYRQARRRSLYKFRAPALLCAIAVVLCELIARPFAEMGIADDFSYIRTTQKLAETAHLYRGTGPVFLHMPLRVLLTVLSIGGLFCLAAAVFRIVRFWPRTRSTSSPAAESMDFPQPGLSSAPNAIHGNSLAWHQLLVLLVPFAAAYCVLLLPRSAFSLFDRYPLALPLMVLILVLRFAPQHLYARLPWPISPSTTAPKTMPGSSSSTLHTSTITGSSCPLTRSLRWLRPAAAALSIFLKTHRSFAPVTASRFKPMPATVQPRLPPSLTPGGSPLPPARSTWSTPSRLPKRKCYPPHIEAACRLAPIVDAC
jgi:hypothetical protein